MEGRGIIAKKKKYLKTEFVDFVFLVIFVLRYSFGSFEFKEEDTPLFNVFSFEVVFQNFEMFIGIRSKRSGRIIQIMNNYI